jgi:hypothetical protein
MINGQELPHGFYLPSASETVALEPPLALILHEMQMDFTKEYVMRIRQDK